MTTLKALVNDHKLLAVLTVLAGILAAVLAEARMVDLAIWFILVLVAAWRFSSLRTGPSDQEKREESEREERESRELPSPLKEDKRFEKWFDLRKLEYDKAADRYDNIYRAIWQNFSYMVVLAGGILTFGGKDLDRAVLYCLALAPLAFWFVATFLPMDHYGDETRKRLSSIEDEINRTYFPKPTDPKLQHFKSFKLSKYKWRVQDAVRYSFVIISALWALMAVLAVDHALRGSTNRELPTPRQAMELEPKGPFNVEMRDPQTTAMRESLAVLSTRVLVIDSLVRCQLDAAKARRRPTC